MRDRGPAEWRSRRNTKSRCKENHEAGETTIHGRLGTVGGQR